MKKKTIICEIGLPADVDDKTIDAIIQLLNTNQNMPNVIYVDTFVEEVEEEE